MKSFEDKSQEEKSILDGRVSKAGDEAEGGGGAIATTTDSVSQDQEETSVQDSTVEEQKDSPAVEFSEEDIEPKESRMRHFWPPTKGQLWTAIAFGCVFILGVVLRFVNLGVRPLHHDESLHAYYSMLLLDNNIHNWYTCATTASTNCYHYDPLLHGPFQFHIIAFVYQISQWLGVADNGINTTTVRIAAACLGSLLVILPYFLREHIGKVGAWLSSFFLAVSPSQVYYSRFAREDIYMAFFTLLLVVAVARYIRTRKASALIMAAVAFTLSYATNEATFLTIAVFGSFMAALICWEIGLRWKFPWRKDVPTSFLQKNVPRTWGFVAVVGYFVVLGLFAKWFFGQLEVLSKYITASTFNTNVANEFVTHLKQDTQLVLPWLGILLAFVVFALLLRDQYGRAPQGRHGFAKHIDPQKQPLLDTIFTMPWTQWFFALVIGWFLFIVLFTVLFTYMPNGIGDGIWQGLYYWIQQQQVARGGQPWYYYLLLIPLYEQIGVVFGLVGVVYSLLHPTRIRLFLVYWFIGNLVIYSWAGEKMPWLTIHITLPMLILAGIALQPAVLAVFNVIKKRFSEAPSAVQVTSSDDAAGALPEVRRSPINKGVFIGSIATLVLAVLLLVPTLQNMYQLSFIHDDDAPHEMMIYVQTTQYVNTVMDKIAQVDQQMYGGKHQIPIAVTDDATWPYAWYLRDYTDVCFGFPEKCSTSPNAYPIIIGSGDGLFQMQQQFSSSYQYHEYPMRTQWDQGYMPPACQKTPTNRCTTPQPYTGVGPWLWLSYGDNPPPGAKFNVLLAASNIWQWWWTRKPFGSIDGAYDMGIFISNNAVNATGVKP